MPVTDLSNETSNETFDLVTPLEPRLVFDGAAANDALDGLVVDAIDLSDIGHVDAGFDFTDGLALVAERDIAADRREVIFVDASIANLTNILGQLPETAEIQLVDSSTDGIAAIANWASTQTNIDAIHIISHGAQGELYLGSSVLSNGTIAAVSAELTTLGGALTETGDILLYGCNIADGAAGLDFIERFAQATSADVAASSDDTGTAVLGGDWDLEVQAGDIDVGSLVLTDFDGVLAVTVADQTFIENQSAVIIDPSAVVSTGGAYNSGYVEFNISSSVSTDRLTVVAGNGSAGTITVSSNVVTYHDPTYGGIPIGTIDSVKNGLNGQPLRVNFYSITTVPGTSNLANGDFSNGTTGWNLFQSRVNFGSSFTVNGVTVPTPTDAQMAAVSNGTSNDNTPSTASSLSVGVTNGALSLSTGSMTIDSYGIYHGPAAVSNAFFADAGDVLQFDYSASANGDDYHVAGYLYNTSTNQIVMALNDTGRTASGTAVVNVPTSANYRFVFIVGTYDASGGRAAGASMTIDNIRAEDPYSIPSSAIQQFVRSVAYQSTSEAPAASKSINITTNDGSTSSTDTSVVSITAVNDAPVLSGTTFNLTTITEDDSTNAGQLVSAIVGTAITDVDASPVEGIAITSLTESAGSGVWQYQLSGSSTWVTVGAVDTTSALLLGANDKIRFLPDEAFGGTASFTFNAWDQTSGTAGSKVAIGSTGGTTAFSTASKTANITVTSIDDAPVLTASATGTEMLTGTARAIAPGLTITDVDSTTLSGAKVSVSNLKSGDVLAVSGTLPTGITASYSASTGVLTLSGSASLADYQAVLRAVTFDTTSTDTTDRTFDFSLGEALAFSGNGHYYEFVSASGIEWADAKAAAEARTFLGMQGYLVTVTSAEENAFVASKLAGEGWMGASDATTEGAWYWVTGPEAGTQFWQGTSTGTVVGGEYNNWASGEPNDSGSNEDHAHFLSGGTWNDYRYNNSNIDGYVVEYGTSTSGSGVASLKSVVSTVTRAVLTNTAIEWGTARDGAEAAGNALVDNLDGSSLIFKVTQVKKDGGTYGSVAASSTSSTNPTEVTGLYGTLKIGEDGSYTYDPTDYLGDVQALNTGEQLTDSFILNVVDANGAVAERTLVMTIDGTNDAPVAIDATASVNEDAASISGTLTSNDVDNTNAERTYTLDADVAGLTLATDGSWTFDAGDDAYQYLQAGETLNVVANFTVEDDEGATDGGTLTITLTGVNDGPVFGEVSGLTSVAPTSGSGMARSTTVGTGTSAEVFLGGKFIEVGIHSSGSYGTSGSAPEGFYGTSGNSKVGLSNDVDGYGIGNDYRIDYFLPGSPAEGFAIGVNGTSYENYGLRGSEDLTGVTVVDLSEVGSGLLKAKISGTTPEGLLMEIIVSFEEDASYFNTEVTLTNTTASALTDVRYIRGFDPDNTVFYGGDFTTDNEIVATVSEDGYAVVKATSLADNYSANTGAPATVLFYSADPRARTSIGGDSFQISDVYGSSMLTDLGENGQRTFTGDVGISIGFEEATLAAGASTTFSYVTSLDNADVATTLSAISGAGFDETNAPLSESGTIAVSDVDLLDEVTAAITNVSAVFDDGTEVDLATAMPALFTAGQGMFTISPADPAILIDNTETTDDLTWTFDSGTETFDFLAQGEKITFTYTITVTDTQGATATQDVDITINGTNDAPVVEEVIPETVSVTGAQISYPTAYAFSDIDASDVLVYSASGLPPGMTIDPATGIISGSSIVPDDYTVIITATDPFGGTVDAAPFILKVVSPPAPPAPLPPANDGPPAGPADIFTPEVTTDTVLKKTAPGKGLSKPAGEPNGGGMPAAGGSTGMVSAATLSTGSIAIARPLPDMGVTSGPVGFIVPRDTFITTASSLSLSASLADGSALPDWLEFDAETGEFSGTPPEGYEGELDLMVKARDSNGGEASTSFTLTVGDLAEQDAKLEILDWDSIETDFASVETGKAVKGAAPLSQVLKATRIGVGAVSFDTVIAAE